MTRTSHAPAMSESDVGGTTILPGVPMPSWLRPDEPIAPEPDPAPPQAHPTPDATAAAVLSVGQPEPAASDSASADTFLLEAAAAAAAAREARAAEEDQQQAPPVSAYPTAPPAPETVAAAAVTQLAADAVVASPIDTAAADGDLDTPAEAGRRGRHGHRIRRGGATATAVAAEAATSGGDAVPQLAPPTPVAPRAELYAAAGAAPPTAPWGTPPVGGPVDLEPPTTEPVELAALGAEPAGDHSDDESTGRSTGGSRRTVVALGALGAVLVLGAVAAFVWPGFLVTDDTTTTAVARPTVPVASTVTLSPPATVAGLTALTGARADALATAASAAVLAGYDAPVSAVYGTGTTPAATVLAWKATKPGRPADLTSAFGGYQGTTGQPVTGIAPVDTGKLGGQMSCGSSVVGATPASVCFWSDGATFGAVTVLKPASATAGATTAVAIRTAIEKKS